MEQKLPPHGECPRCGFVTPLNGGLITHHKRLRRRKWLPCPGIASRPIAGYRCAPKVPYTGMVAPVETHKLEPEFIDRRSSSAPDEPRYVAGVDPSNPTGPAVVIDSVTGEIVYRRKKGAKGVQ